MDHTYLLFTWAAYEAGGGFNDFSCAAATVPEVKMAFLTDPILSSSFVDSYQIVSMLTLQIIEEGDLIRHRPNGTFTGATFKPDTDADLAPL